jgi:8-oxo-dGTP pyrophosphatase MutT (NUDIX family)
MSLLRHIRACNTYRPERFVPLLKGETRVGLVRRDNAAVLKRFPLVLTVDAETVHIVAPGDAAAVSAALDDVVEELVGEGLVNKWRNEVFTVARHWGEAPLFSVDRGAVSFFGVRAYGVHLNGYRRDGNGLQLWIGRRNPLKLVAPGKLDNLVAGGIGGGIGAAETLMKEAEEEASIPKPLIAQARAVGAVTYKMEVAQGLRDDVLFLYDLETPDDFEPRNNDGEIVEFMRMTARDVVALVRDTDDFKFNVNLTIIDFALRHGLLTPEDPEYLSLLVGLHRGGD